MEHIPPVRMIEVTNNFPFTQFKKIKLLYTDGNWYESDIPLDRKILTLRPVVEQQPKLSPTGAPIVEENPVNSAHSFTEGSEVSQSQGSGEWSKDINAFKEKQDKFEKQFPGVDNKPPYEKPSLDYQIEALKEMCRILDKEYLSSKAQQGAVMAIEENLLAIKRFNQSPVLQNVDVEKVIKDLVLHVKLLETKDHFEIDVKR
jgi:hypothetical protein